MNGAKWTLVKIDAATATVHLQLAVDATLECYQTSFAGDGTKALLGTFDLKIPTWASSEGPPLGLRCAESAVDLFATITLESDKAVKVRAFQRNPSDQHTLRKRGGKAIRDASAPPLGSKAGYTFAKASLSDDELRKGTKGIVFRGMQDTCCVRLRFGKHGKPFILTLLFPADPVTYFLYDEQTAELSFKLVVKDMENTWELKGPRVRLPAHEYRSDSSDPNMLITALKAEYGNPRLHGQCLHPRDYRRYLSSPHYGQQLIDCADKVAAHLNKNIPVGLEFSVSPLEILTTFLCEGANEVLNSTADLAVAKFSGYGNLGIDSLVTRWKNGDGHIRDYVTEDLKKALSRNTNRATQANEQLDVWETLDILDYRKGIAAVGALYTLAKEWFAGHLNSGKITGPWKSKTKNLPEHVQFFWGTTYFNAGEKRAPGRLAMGGVEYHDEPWRLEDSFSKHSADAKYNANWRTATFRLLQTMSI